MPPKRKAEAEAEAAPVGDGETEEVFDIQGLVRFLVGAKIPLARAMSIAAALSKLGLSTKSQISSCESLKSVIPNEADHKLVVKACSKKVNNKNKSAKTYDPFSMSSGEDLYGYDKDVKLDPGLVVKVNRAPYLIAFTYRLLKQITVLDDASALSVAQALASESAQMKAVSLNLSSATPSSVTSLLGTTGRFVNVMGRKIRVMQSDDERVCKAFDLAKLSDTAVTGVPTYDPLVTWRYLKRSFPKDTLSQVFNALDSVFQSHITRHMAESKDRTAAHRELDKNAWMMYIRTRPDVQSGVAGWGQKGDLPLSKILSLIVTLPVTKVEREQNPLLKDVANDVVIKKEQAQVKKEELHIKKEEDHD